MGEVGLGKLGLSDSFGTAAIIDETVAATYLRHLGKWLKAKRVHSHQSDEEIKCRSREQDGIVIVSRLPH